MTNPEKEPVNPDIIREFINGAYMTFEGDDPTKVDEPKSALDKKTAFYEALNDRSNRP